MKDVFFDKEYIIMSEIEGNDTLTQRELSNKLGVSVSTVNVLINKMIKEGLIKINQVSKRQVLYMLTPQGILEKTKKTAQYLKSHYRAIYETKEKIKSVLTMLSQKHDVIFILMPKDEMGEIVRMAIGEFIERDFGVEIILSDNIDMDFSKYKTSVLLHMNSIEAVQQVEGVTIKCFNLMNFL